MEREGRKEEEKKEKGIKGTGRKRKAGCEFETRRFNPFRGKATYYVPKVNGIPICMPLFPLATGDTYDTKPAQ